MNYVIISVDNAVEATEFYEKAESNGAKKIKTPEEKPWGQGVAYVEDNLGTIVEICSPRG